MKYWRIFLMLAPTLTVIVVLFGGSLIYGFLQSLGWQPRIGETNLSLEAYTNIIAGDEYRQQFWTGLLLSLWVSFASTAFSAIIAVGAALLIRRMTWGQRVMVWLFQFNLPVPHIVGAIGILFLLSQSGLISRFGAEMGFLSRPSDFPVIVRDSYGLGIIIAYLWKEVPFIGVIMLAVLQSLGSNYEERARTLGATAWQRFRYVTLPLITPGLLSTSIIVFAFTFGAYEVPEILGVRYPQTLPVLSLDFYLNADLGARAEGMALSVIITVIVIVLVAIYMRLNEPTASES